MSYIVIGLSSGVPWPKQEANVEFKGQEFILRPETETLLPSLVFKLNAQMTWEQGMSRCREFFSVLSWVDGAPIREEIVSGGGRAVSVGKSPHWKSVHVDRFHIRYLPQVGSRTYKLGF